MSAAEANVVHSWQVGAFTVTLSIPPISPDAIFHAVCNWTPTLPGRPLTASERLQYEAGLAEALVAVRTFAGGDS